MAKKSQTGGFGADVARAIWIVAFSTVLGLIVNAYSGHSLAIFSEPVSNEPMAAADLEKSWKRGEAVLLLDVRGQVEYESGHSPRALHVPLDSLMERHEAFAPNLEGASVIVTMCDSAECAKAEEAAEMLAKLGYKNVRVLKGGWEAFRMTNLPVETGRR